MVLKFKHVYQDNNSLVLRCVKPLLPTLTLLFLLGFSFVWGYELIHLSPSAAWLPPCTRELLLLKKQTQLLSHHCFHCDWQDQRDRCTSGSSQIAYDTVDCGEYCLVKWTAKNIYKGGDNPRTYLAHRSKNMDPIPTLQDTNNVTGNPFIDNGKFMGVTHILDDPMSPWNPQPFLQSCLLLLFTNSLVYQSLIFNLFASWQVLRMTLSMPAASPKKDHLRVI